MLIVNLSDREILNFALESGIIDVDIVRQNIEMNERKKFLEKHPYNIWQGKDKKWYTYIPDDTKGRLQRKRSTREEIESIIIDYWKDEEEKIYFQDVFNEWMHERREFGEIEMSSYARYYTDFKRFFKENEQFCKLRFQQIEEHDIERFIKKQIKDKELTKKAYSMLRILIIGTFRFAKSRGYTKISISTFFKDLYLPDAIFKRKKKKSSEEEVFSENEVVKLANYFRNNPTIINMGLLLQFQTGLRVGELSSLKREDIKGRYINVSNTEENYKDPDTNERVVGTKNTTKSQAGDRLVIIPDGAKSTIDTILSLSNGEYLFSKNGKRITTNSFRYYLEKACLNVGINPRSPHKTRKTYASTLLANSVNETLVQEMMGHADISTTRKCYYYDMQSRSKREKEIDRVITL